MDFLQQFLEVALGRLTGGETTPGADSSMQGMDFMSYLSSAQSAKKMYDATNDESLTGRQKGQRVTEGFGKLIGDYFTGGQVSTITNKIEDKFPGVRNTMEDIDSKINPFANIIGRLFAPKGEKGLRNPF